MTVIHAPDLGLQYKINDPQIIPGEPPEQQARRMGSTDFAALTKWIEASEYVSWIAGEYRPAGEIEETPVWRQRP
ncbi:MAG: hypothetical protein AAF755_10170 [Pseudomonadota bacterium]